MRHRPWPGLMADTPYPAAILRCYQELGDRLPQSLRGRDFPVDVRPGEILAKLLSRLELPGEEVDLALVNGLPVGFSRIVRPGDRVSLYPVFESLDISSLTGLRRTPLRRLRFVTDHGLEDLAALLAEAGQTVRTCRGIGRSELARTSRERGEVLLTRDPGLIRKHDLEKAYVPSSPDAPGQLREVLRRFDLAPVLPRDP